MTRKSKWSTRLILLLAVGLVAGPVLLPREIARWYLAAAQNAYRTKNSILAEHYLSQAVAWDENIKNDGDYWIAQVANTKVQNADQLLDLIEKAVMSDSRWAPKALEASQVLAEEHDYQRAVRALKIAFLNQRPTTPIGLNQLAYFRSLAGLELEEALKDIDEAISQTINGADLNDVLRRQRVERAGELGGYLDTKAWVLHAMKRDLEALGLMHKAIEYVEQELKLRGIEQPEPLTTEELAHLESDSDIEAAIGEAKKRLDMTYNLAVLRFHRLKIMEALAKSSGNRQDLLAEAEADRQWLLQRGVPVVDELF